MHWTVVSVKINMNRHIIEVAQDNWNKVIAIWECEKNSL